MVPCYNAEHLLPHFFASVERMSPKPTRIIFTHNNCTDKTADVLKQFKSYSSVPCDIYELFFAKDETAKRGVYSVMGDICQFLWLKARDYSADWTYLTACDTFAASPDILSILSDWDVPYVTARVMRSFPEGICLSAKWRHPTDPALFRMCKPRAVFRWLTPNKLCVARPLACGIPLGRNGETTLFDDSALMASGFHCYRRDLLWDARLNWTPIPVGCSEDFGFNKSMRELGYKVCIDGVAIVDHVVYDCVHERKAWSKDVEDGKEVFMFE